MARWTEHSKVAAVRKRSAPANALAHAIDNFRFHRTGRHAALVAHYGFLSVFPLMIVFTTILGLVLENRPKLREEIVDSVFSRIPIIGPTLKENPAELTGSWPVLIIGLLLTLWASLRAFNVLQTALDDIAEVPLDDRRNLVQTRLRSLLGIGVIGGSQVGTAVLTSVVGIHGIGGLLKVIAGVGAVAVNSVVLAATYRWLCAANPPWRRLWPGAIAGGFAFAVLQVLGTAVVARSISNASPVYGTFASVIGVLGWLNLHALFALLGAELNRVLPARRLSAW